MQEEKTDRSATRVPAGEGSSVWLFTDLHTLKAVGEDESYDILEGEYEFLIDGRTFMAGPGSFVCLPKGQLHMHRNAGDAPAPAA